ncbi:MAG: hypothetical protein MUF34_24650 [Polyangiaceae bacterium]|jgi:hypothetical protein|nr:hypothetical protein [Polyangiaceae bacterium]
MTPHPSADRLDALAAGDDDAEASTHLAACEACRAYVGRAGAEIASFRAAAEPTRFAETIAARAAAPQRAAETVVALPARPRVPVLVGTIITVAAPALAAAAALAFLLRGGAGPGPNVAPSAEGPRAALSAPGDAESSRFKGGPVLALIRERDGKQERLSGAIAVRADDRVRVEVSLDAGAPLAIAFLGDDGSFVPLSPPSFAEAGTHFSAEALRFDRSNNGGVVIAGPPEAIERVRVTKRLDGVVGARIVDER